MRYILILILSLSSIITFAQTDDEFTIVKTNLDHSKYTSSIYDGDMLRYMGNFDTKHKLPVGTHYMFDSNGKLDKVIVYQFAQHKWEDTPFLIQETYEINSNGKLEAYKKAKRCVECEYTPIDIWYVYDDAGEILKSFDMNLGRNSTMEHPKLEYFYELVSGL